MTCPHCGTMIGEEDMFCGGCGNRVAVSPSAEHVVELPVPLHRKPSVGAKIGAVFAAVFMTLFVLLSMGCTLIDRVFSADTIGEIIDEVEITQILDLFDISVDEWQIPTDNLQDIYEESGLKDVLDIGDILGDIVEGERPDVPTAREIADVIDRNRRVIERITGYAVTDGDCEDIYEFFSYGDGARLLTLLRDFPLEDLAYEWQNAVSNESISLYEVFQTISVVRILLNLASVAASVFLVLALLMAFLIFMLYKRSGGSLLACSIIILVPALLLCLTGAAGYIVVAAIAQEAWLAGVLTVGVDVVMGTGAVYAALAGVMLTIAVILKEVQSKRKAVA